MRLRFEFIVSGTPVSLQAKRPASLARWKAEIVAASRVVLPENHFATRRPLSITLYYFPDGVMEGDLDNIVKPIPGALSHHPLCR